MDTSSGFFKDADDMLDTIDSVSRYDVAWNRIQVRYNGPTSANDPPWMHEPFKLYHRDIVQFTETVASNPEFDGSWEYIPYEEHQPVENGNMRVFENLMSGRFAWKQAVRTMP